jgi:hypothetical protein
MCVRAEQAVDQYTHTGGRLMYLGANGFYWHVAFPDGVTHCQPPPPCKRNALHVRYTAYAYGVSLQGGLMCTWAQSSVGAHGGGGGVGGACDHMEMRRAESGRHASPCQDTQSDII